MDTETTVIVVLLAAILITLFWVAYRLISNKKSEPSGNLETAIQLLKADLIARQSESLMSLRDSLDAANRTINNRLAEGTSSLDRRMSVLGELENRLGQLATQTTNIESIGKNIQSLSELLRPPKLRGILGELLLDNLLQQILPKAMYHIQHRFGNGLRVDAAVKIGERLLPIDAKFPMESYERLSKQPDDETLQREFSRTFRKHVDDIATKYIQPQENTTDFAVMYIPAEAVYYQFVAQQQQGGFEYALSKKVIPSSPGHLYAFLVSVATVHSELSLANSELLGDARQLLAVVNDLTESSDKLAKFHERMESSLRTLSGSFEKARNELSGLRTKLSAMRTPLADDPDTESITSSETTES
ncbi:MAG: hypothetical protein DRP45_01045 [Candidatus Zixiibacteriota bacterium]|nr:MAG: hypothetical protein DRP45_01045 [candidate division Zixibacteria bacterium]